MSKTVFSLGMFLGFSDELQKIASVVEMSSSGIGSSQANKASPAVSVPKQKLPKLVSKPQPPQEFTPSQDHIRSMKSQPPPPVRV